MGVTVSPSPVKVVVASVGGPAGAQGVPGQSAIQRTAASAMSAGQVVRTHAAGQQMQAATSDLRTRPFDAILLGDIGSGATGNFHVAGPVPANVLQLGAGVACAVGVDATGRPVRATDPTCVSAPNWLGYCDASGNVTFAPNNLEHLDPHDFGADSSGTSINDDAFASMIATAAISGTVIRFPEGVFRYTKTIDLTDCIGVTMQGAGASHTGSTTYNGTVLQYEGLGDGVRQGTFTLGNVPVNAVIRDFTIRCLNPGNQAPGRESPSATLPAIIDVQNIGGLISIATASAHGLATGNLVAIDSVTGCTNANSGWTITVTSPDTFTLDGSTFGPSAYAGGGRARIRCGAGLAAIGASQFEWSNIYCTGFGVGFMLDGAENATLYRCTADGYGGNSGLGNNPTRLSCGVWLTDGDSGCSGWTVSGSTNQNDISRGNYNGARLGFQIDGCASVTITRCLMNIGTDVVGPAYAPYSFARINRATALEFNTCYTEGAGDAHILFEKQSGSSSATISQCVTFRNHTALGNCPAIKITLVAVEELSIIGTFWITAQAIGGGLVTGNHVRIGNRVGNGFMTPGQTFWDVPTSAFSELISEYNVNLP